MASAAAPASDWIEWTGGERPVAPDTLVDFRLRFGQETTGWLAKECDWSHEPMDHHDYGYDIIAYRVVAA
ncbi:MAG TPA: hypothetical protein VF638_00845 [Sphingomonas sp.]|jgi:hypothetical protein